MNLFQKIARGIIKGSFNFSVFLIKLFHKKQSRLQKMNELKKYPYGSLGYDIALCLELNQLQFVPKYESHDLKHVLLDYKMTAEDEIRMQAFMLGNGNYSVPCVAILSFGAILLPDQWSVLRQDFVKGRNSIPISSWTIEQYAAFPTQELRRQIFQTPPPKKSLFTMKKMAKFGAFASIIAGVFGMIFCLPFLFSANTADLIGAGFPFLAGAILSVGGLLSLSILSKNQTQASTTN